MKTNFSNCCLPVKTTFLLLSFCFNTLVLAAQSAPQAPKRMEVYMEVLSTDTTNLQSDTLFHTHTKLVATMVMLLSDTTNITYIHVKIGTTDGASNLFSKTFEFNSSGVFSDSTSLKRNGDKLYLGVGNYMGLNTFYSETYFENASNMASAVVKYVKK